jgi:hypothetical protein
MAVLTAITVASEASNSLSAVESQKVAIVRVASMPATGWMIFVMALLPFASGYATQMPGTATFWNRCGEATAERG